MRFCYGILLLLGDERHLAVLLNGLWSVGNSRTLVDVVIDPQLRLLYAHHLIDLCHRLPGLLRTCINVGSLEWR